MSSRSFSWEYVQKNSNLVGLNTKNNPPRRSALGALLLVGFFFCIQTNEVGFFLYSHEKERELIITSVIFILRHMYVRT